MIRSLILALLLALSIGAPAALADDEPAGADDEPAVVADEELSEPEPIDDFWSAEAEAIERERAALPPDAPPAPAAAPVVPAPAPVAAGVPVAPAPLCDPDVMLRVALDALRPLARQTLPARAGRSLGTLRLTPCMAGRVRLQIIVAGSGAVLASAERVLKSTRTATFRLRTTSAVRRYAGRGPIRLRLRADFSLR